MERLGHLKIKSSWASLALMVTGLLLSCAPASSTSKINIAPPPLGSPTAPDVSQTVIESFTPRTWVLREEVADSMDGQVGDLFGKRVALSGDWAVIASPDFGLDTSMCQGCRSSQGKVSLFHHDSQTGWNLNDSLEGMLGQGLGSNVFLSGDLFLVGLRESNLTRRYSVRDIQLNGLSTLNFQEINSPDPALYPAFGGAMEASSSHLVIASLNALHLYTYPDSGLIRSFSSESYNTTGLGFALYQNEILVGDNGKVKCYQSEDQFQNSSHELSSATLEFDVGSQFGNMLAVSESYLAISASERVHIFKRAGICQWSFVQTLSAVHSLPGSQFGSWLSMTQDLLAVGSQADPYPGHSILNFLPPLLPEDFFAEAEPRPFGSVTIYTLKDQAWIPTAYINSPAALGGPQKFGRGISLSTNRMLVGTEINASLGAAYFFELLK